MPWGTGEDAPQGGRAGGDMSTGDITAGGMAAGDSAEALVYTGPRRAEIRRVALPPLAPGWVEIRTTHGALSRGTERLVFEGRVPESEWSRMRAPFQEGDFPFPVRYGYAAVGEVVAAEGDAARALIGRRVFALHPHQTRLRLPVEAVCPLPDGVPPERAVLAANAETALNAIWDADLAPGSRVAVIGAGLVGALVAGQLSSHSDLKITLVDVLAPRRSIAREFNFTFRHPTELASDHVAAFHCSATAGGLKAALDCLVFEGRVIELSWYGDAEVPVPLGGAFHARRLRIVSSQVGHVARSRRASTSHAERLAAALATLRDPRFDILITEEVAFGALPAALPRLLAPDAPGIATRIAYD